jgi:hypothetical protein
MTWERFGYVCRKAAVDCQDHETISACLSRIEAETACDLYGSSIASDSWPRVLLDAVGHMENKGEALAAIEIYKNLNLTKQFEEPMRFKRVIAYLSYISIIFYIVVVIYQLYVTPSFLNAFENFDIAIPAHLLFYQDCWGYFVLVVSIFLVSALLVGFQVRNLFNFNIGVEDGFIIKHLMFFNIRQSYLRLIDILQFPIHCYGQSESMPVSPVTNHLLTVKNSNMSLPIEMQELIEIEMQFLLESCEKQMKLISVLVAVIVVAAIFFFLVSAYSPIFILGETV